MQTAAPGSRLSQHSFASIPDVRQSRSQMNRSSSLKTAIDFDYIYPIFTEEVLPGDTMNLSLKHFSRLATQVVPVLDNMYLDFFFFFVPNRLTYTYWENMMGANKPDPSSSTSYLAPYLDFAAGKPDALTIYDYFGLPTDPVGDWTLANTLPLRCYNLIWNAWFRDENLQDSVIENTDAGPDVIGDYTLLKRGKRHDYFTSALPWPQKGTAVSLPLGTSAPVLGIGTLDSVNFSAATSAAVRETGSIATQTYAGYYTSGSAAIIVEPLTAATSSYPNIRADLSAATAATINQLRLAFMTQSLLELDARGGTRYVEILKAHFGVTSPDFRLQRPEYLGGGTSTINVHPVAQTAISSGSNSLGQLAAFATASSSGGGIGFSKSFTEHGYVLGLVCARADITYQQGLHKMWSRSTRLDWFWPKLQELGEQAILNKEIYLDGSANDELVFGYQERYGEYRYRPSQITGVMRSQYATPLDQWHLAEEFSSLPALNSTFIVQNTPIERAIAVDTEPDLLMDCWFQLTHARPMLSYPAPASLGRF